MAKKRGFFAELQHQQQVAQRQNLAAQSAAKRAQLAAARLAEQAQKQAERAHAQAAKATVAEQKAAEHEAARLRDEAIQAEVGSRNAELVSAYSEIDSLLSATLTVDDFVDLEQLRATAEHPAFPHPELTWPTPRPTTLNVRPEPVYVEPPAPTGIGGLLGRKKHAEAVAQAQTFYAGDHAAWEREVAAARVHQQQVYEQTEQQRLARLQQAQATYEAACRQRELDVAESNRRLDALIQGLAYGVDEAVQEYVSIVLSNSVYPDAFPVAHDFEFNAGLKELTLVAIVPAPDRVPAVREYKYVKAKDEIVGTALPVKEQKERYANAVAQVALRTVHEVFEADRAGWIQTISLTVATETLDVATGLDKRVPLIAVAADRPTYTTYNLANVVPTATLQHMGALISKNPFDLAPIDTSKGVRGR